jgi:hypothetical protein
VICSQAIAAAFALSQRPPTKPLPLKSRVVEAIARPAASPFETEFDARYRRRNGEVPTLGRRGERQLLTFHQHLYDLIAPCPRLSVKFYSGHFNFAFRLSSTLCSDQANQYRQKSRKVLMSPSTGDPSITSFDDAFRT